MAIIPLFGQTCTDAGKDWACQRTWLKACWVHGWRLVGPTIQKKRTEARRDAEMLWTAEILEIYTVYTHQTKPPLPSSNTIDPHGAFESLPSGYASWAVTVWIHSHGSQKGVANWSTCFGSIILSHTGLNPHWWLARSTHRLHCLLITH